MGSLELDRLAADSAVFIDSSIFVYHFTGVSAQCRNLLERCERAELKGATSVTVLAEVTHRLLMIEAVQSGAVRSGNVASRLRTRPDVIRTLPRTREQVARIPLMGIEVHDLTLRLLLAASDLQRDHGLMTNDSIIAATALEAGIHDLASADRDFERLQQLNVYAPIDLP